VGVVDQQEEGTSPSKAMGRLQSEVGQFVCSSDFVVAVVVVVAAAAAAAARSL